MYKVIHFIRMISSLVPEHLGRQKTLPYPGMTGSFLIPERGRIFASGPPKRTPDFPPNFFAGEIVS